MKYKCPECGGDLIVRVENTIIYTIDKDGKLKKDSANHESKMQCINNEKHKINAKLRNLLIKHLARDE